MTSIIDSLMRKTYYNWISIVKYHADVSFTLMKSIKSCSVSFPLFRSIFLKFTSFNHNQCKSVGLSLTSGDHEYGERTDGCWSTGSG